MIVHLLDIEWLLSTLFDASLFNFRAAGNGGSFFALSHFGSNREAAVAAAEAAKRQTPQIVRRPCSNPWPAGNYVCTFAFEMLDMATAPEQSCHSEWRKPTKNIFVQ
jgi:hypothetical protein